MTTASAALHADTAATAWLAAFDEALTRKDVDAAAALFCDDGHLRDLRVLENHVIRIAEESQAVHEANLSKLRSISK